MGRKHLNPYRVNDEKNWFEVGENSSHPELDDSKRVWKFNGRHYKTATDIEKHFKEYGLRQEFFKIQPRSEIDGTGHKTIIIEVVEK